MSDKDKKLDTAVVSLRSLGKLIDDLQAQLEQYQEDVLKQQKAINELKADFYAQKEETEKEVRAVLEDSKEDLCRKIEESISEEVIKSVTEKKKEK